MASYFWLAALIGFVVGYLSHKLRQDRRYTALLIAVSDLMAMMAETVVRQPDMTQKQREYWGRLLDKDTSA